MTELRAKTKNWLSIVTCLMTFICGWFLTITGFFVPPMGEVSNSVLFVLGQSLLYTGAILGISSHYDSKLQQFEDEIRDKLKK